MNYFIEVLAFFINFFMARYQAKWFDDNKATGKKFSHTPQAIGYGLFVLAVGVTNFLVHHSIKISIFSAIAMVLVRLVVFNFILNRSRHPQDPWFYINATPTTDQVNKGSIVDRIEKAITGNGKLYPILWALYAATFIFFQFKIG